MRFADRGRRAVSVDRVASRTSSYPSGSARERPTCRACLTAATGGGAPSNRRVKSGFTSCSYEQPPPGRKVAHVLIQGNFSFGFRIGAQIFERGPTGAPAPQVNGQQPRQGHHGFLLHRAAFVKGQSIVLTQIRRSGGNHLHHRATVRPRHPHQQDSRLRGPVARVAQSRSMASHTGNRAPAPALAQHK